MLSTKQGSAAVMIALLCASSGWADSLADIYQSALQNDPLLRAARASFYAQRESKHLARAALLPQIAASAEYSESEVDESVSNSSGLTDSDGTSYQVSLRQAIFDMPAWYQLQSGKALSDSARAQFSADQQSLISRVSQAYFSVLRAHDNMQTRRAEERAIQRQLEQTKERFEVGLLPITDVHEAQAVYDDAIVNSLEAQGGLNIAFEALEVLTGHSHQVLAGLMDKFAASEPSPASPQDWVDLAVKHNFQLKVAKLGKDAAYNNAKAATAARLPKISGQVSYFESDSQGTTDSLPFETQRDGHTYSLSLTLPIWQGGSLDASRRQSRQRAIQSDESYVAAKRNVVQSARSIHQLVLTNAARVKARKQAITSADSALKATQAGYEVGTRNIVDVLVAQRALYQARRNRANARYDYILSMMSLKEVAGQLSAEDIFALNGWLDPKQLITR